MIQAFLYRELEKLYIYSNWSKTVTHSAPQVWKTITKKTAQYKYDSSDFQAQA